MHKKMRNAQIDQYNFQFQLVIGKAEVENESVNIRTRENEVKGEMKIDELMAMLEQLKDEY